ERRTPVRGDAQAIQIANPPVTLSLGIEQVAIGDRSQNLQVSARIFDFGVISLRARLEIPRAPWTDFVSMGVAAGSSNAWGIFERCRDRLIEKIRPAIDRPSLARLSEEYIVYRIDRIEDPAGQRLRPDCLADEDI